MAIHTRVEIDDRLTYGDLYTFVDTAKSIGTSPDTKVIQQPIDVQEPERGVGSFEIEITSATGIERPVTLLASEARELAMLLDAICETDGDAREYTTQLTEWHDRLLGLDSD